MNQIKRRMIQRALRTHKRIFPCAHKQDLHECFTQHDDRLLFWFNTEDRSTHVVTSKIPRVIQGATA